MSNDHAKEKAALEALKSVRSGMRLGLGTGSTVYWFLLHLGRALREGRLTDIAGVPTSEQTARQCAKFEISCLELGANPILDLAVDGADEVDPHCDLIKGLGGALLREKMVAVAAKRLLIIADESKLVGCLGQRSPLPVEVVRFAHESHLPYFRNLGAEATLRRGPEGAPFISDNGGYIWDCRFAQALPNPLALAHALDARPGVIDHGLFLGMADEAIIAGPDGIRHLHRP